MRGELVPYEPPALLPVAVRRLGVAALLVVAWGAAVFVAAHVQPDPTLRTAALFLHLASLVLGLGAVLVVDWHGLLWMLGKRSLPETLRLASANHTVIWAGLAGLVLSGMLLHPDLTSPLTRLKLGLVLLIALNGVVAHCVQVRLDASRGRPTPALVLWSATSAGVSQLGWWGATLVGFVNSQS